MEEAELLKERLQAITNKRKIQEDIASKRLEIDRFKLKLQHLKKKSMRDLWLLDGTTAGDGQEVQKAQEEVEQTKLLQSNIHRIEKEIEALEREELNISTNEGLILKRLKAIEKSTEDIIKAANANFKSEPNHIYPGALDTAKPYTPLNLRKHQILDQDPKNDQHKQALLAMEINVQKDLRTGESRVVSASAVSTQELQQRGIKVYDDGRKSVYALRSDAGRPGANGVDELSPREVEELLRQATERKKTTMTMPPPSPSRGHGKSSFPGTSDRSPDPRALSFSGSSSNRLHVDGGGVTRMPGARCGNGYPELSSWPELVYEDGDNGEGVRYPEQGLFQNFDDRSHSSEKTVPFQKSEPVPDFGIGTGLPRYHASNGDSYGEHFCESRQGRGARFLDSDLARRSPSAYSDDSRLSVLNTMPSDEPVTMIFMGYQTADDADDPRSEGSVRAELVVIGDGEEDGEGESKLGASSVRKRSSRSQQNRNANNSGSCRITGRDSDETALQMEGQAL